MPTEKKAYFYWDSCVFMSYINGHKDRMPTIEALWREIGGNNSARIITSYFTQVEVAFAEREMNEGKLDPDIEQAIKNMWRDESVVLVELHQTITDISRDLMRTALERGLSVPKGKDAIHLATARWVSENVSPIIKFHTYDEKLFPLSDLIGIPIKQPIAQQPLLITDDGTKNKAEDLSAEEQEKS